MQTTEGSVCFQTPQLIKQEREEDKKKGEKKKLVKIQGRLFIRIKQGLTKIFVFPLN